MLGDERRLLIHGLRVLFFECEATHGGALHGPTSAATRRPPRESAHGGIHTRRAGEPHLIDQLCLDEF